jgi:uncharacterized protein involved in exopolysaccharide biosynthesis
MRTRDIAVETTPASADDGAMFTVSFQSPEPRTAARVTEKLAILFINENLSERSRIAENTNTFLEGQLSELAKQVDEFAVQIEQDRAAHRASPRSVVLEYEELQNAYRGLLDKRHEAHLAANLEARQIGEQFRVIDPARIPERPEGPDRLSISLLGASIGLAAGLLLLLAVPVQSPAAPPVVIAAASATE